MLINNTEALKSWLVVVLAPLCDADSSALARYVLALLKKDKPENDLKRVMIEQLDVFLGEETTPFVDRLFSAISTEEYLTIPPPPPTISSTPTSLPPTVKLEEFVLEDNISLDVPSTPITTLPVNNMKLPDVSKIPDKSDLKHITSDLPVKNNSAYVEHSKISSIEEQKTKELNHHHYHKSASDATSVNNHQHFKTGSSASTESSSIATNVIGTSTTSSAGNTNPRNVTPTRGSVGTAAATADKENQPRESRRRRPSLPSRSRSRSAERFSRRSRSPRDRRGGQRQFRNKSPSSSSHERRRGGFNACDRRRAPADSNRKTGGTTNRSNPHSSISPSPERQRQQSGGNAGNAASSVNKTAAIENSTKPSNANREHGENGNIVAEKRQRCRDFDEKGYCVRGETCPWDHGVNPVVFEGLNNPALISMSLREYNPDAPDLWSRATPAPGVIPGNGGVVGARQTGINPFTGAPRDGVVNGPGGGIPPTIGYPPHVQVGAGVVMDKASAAQEYSRGGVGVGPTPPGYRGGAPNLMPFPFNALAPPMQQRELITIPVVDADGNSTSASNNLHGEHSVGGPLAQQLPGGKRRYDNEQHEQIALGGMQDTGPTKRKIPLNSRLGPRMSGNNIQSNCSLELRKIPRGLNTIAHLNNHFAKFGKIINIQISYESDPEAAIITFSTHAEANVAYRSTEAVLNNRFIKVFWHSNIDANSSGGAGDNNNSMSNSMGGVGINGARKSTHHYHLNNMITPATTAAPGAGSNSNDTAGGGGTNETNNNPNTASNEATNSGGTVAATHLPAMSLRLKNNVPARSAAGGGVGGGAAVTGAVIRKKQEEQVKAVVQLANGLRKRKQELLQSYVKQMKSALEIVERCDQQDPQRVNTLETIKVLQDTIDKLGKEIAAEQEHLQAQITQQQQHQQQQHPSTNLVSSGTANAGSVLPVIVKKTKEQQKKELLDIELELFAQQQEGNDTTAIQKRLEELQRSLGIGNAPPANSGGGQPSLVGPKLGAIAAATHFGSGNQRAAINQSPRALRGAIFPEGPTRVDRRPKTIVITGFSADEADFVLGHFKHFGEILKHDVDREIPQLILSYNSRISAEQAVMRGKMFKTKRLQISWAPVIPSNTTVSSSVAASNGSAQSIGVPNKEIERKLKIEDAVLNTDENVETEDVKEKKPVVDVKEEVVEKQLKVTEKLPVLDVVKLSEKRSEDAVLPELRLEDEEEDDECEDRSWRR